MKSSAVERFWRRVDKSSGETGCWIWLGSKHKSGHGQIAGGDGKLVYTHRFAWELANGPIERGLCVCHKCDVPACVNPAHMFLGTRSENLRDMWAKARGVHNDNSKVCTQSRRIQSSMSDDDIYARVILPFANGAMVSDICAATGLGNQCVRNIVAGRTRRLPMVSDEQYGQAAEMLVKRRRRPDGEGSANGLLTNAQAREIRERAHNGERAHQLAAAYGVAPHTIYGILHGRTYASAGGPITHKIRHHAA